MGEGMGEGGREGGREGERRRYIVGGLGGRGAKSYDCVHFLENGCGCILGNQIT